MDKYKLGTFNGKGVSHHNKSGASCDGFYIGVTLAEKKIVELRSIVGSTKFMDWLMSQFVSENPDIFPKEVYIIHDGEYMPVKVKRYSINNTVVVYVKGINGKAKQKTVAYSEVFLSKKEGKFWADKRIKEYEESAERRKKELKEYKRKIKAMKDAVK